ncbi:MAG: hypothetical protein WAT23_19050 [Chromatiaceae bacterium]
MQVYDANAVSAYNWHELDNGNLITSDGGKETLIFAKKGGGWGIVADGVFAKGSFDTSHKAVRAYETGVVTWNHPQGWAMNKSGTGWWRNSTKVGILSVKQAKSGSWYWHNMGSQPRGWFDDCKSAQAAADEFAAHGARSA